MALLLAGCSLGFVAGPPPEHPQLASFGCTDSHVAPIIDSVLGGLAGVTFLTAVGTTDEKWAMDNARLGSRTDVALLYGSLAAIEGASALFGYYNVHACRAARQAAAERVQGGMQRLPPTWPPAPVGPAGAPAAQPPVAPPGLTPAPPPAPAPPPSQP